MPTPQRPVYKQTSLWGVGGTACAVRLLFAVPAALKLNRQLSGYTASLLWCAGRGRLDDLADAVDVPEREEGRRGAARAEHKQQ